MQYLTLRRVTVIGLAGSLMLAMGTKMVALGTTLAILITVVLAYLMHKHRDKLVKLHQRREAEFAVPRPNDAMLWRTKPRLSDMAPGLVVFGPCFLVLAYLQSQQSQIPERLFMRLVYELFGPFGITALMCYFGLTSTVYGLEILISQRLQKRGT